MRILKVLEKNKQFWFVIFIIGLFFILRFPSLFEPLWYGDEGIYQVIGNSLNHGKILYSQIFDNKPPLLYWIYAALQSDQFLVRLTSLTSGIFAIIVFFFLAKKLFENSKGNFIPILTTSIFAILFGLPTLEGNIANAENFMLLPILIAALFVFKRKKFFLIGLLLGLAFLIKIVAIFDLGAFLIFYFIVNLDSFKKEVRRLSKILIGFLLPIFLVIIYFFSNGAFADFIKATFTNNISYVGYGNKIGALPILLLIKLAILIIFLVFIFIKRKLLNPNAIFILIWFAFSLFNAFFSQRPYTHYLLVLISSFSLMIGLVLYSRQYRIRFFLSFIIGIYLITKIFGIPNFGKSIYYYKNFITYASGQKTVISYQSFFDKKTPYDYEITNYIKPKVNSNDTIFVWGNNAQLYQLTGTVAPTKYVVAYHITNYNDGFTSAYDGIKSAKPKFIVIMRYNESSFSIPIGYIFKIEIANAKIYERSF